LIPGHLALTLSAWVGKHGNDALPSSGAGKMEKGLANDVGILGRGVTG